MSAIAGIYNVGGRPADVALLQRMAGAISHRGPDGINHWIGGPVGFTHMMLHTTPEALKEKQPLTHETSDLCLTLDGRVDNRKQLRSELESKGQVVRTDTDAELVLLAYQCWGENCAQHIIGDFAFAIWNGRTRTLFCARDLMGIRAFYYIFDGNTFSFCTELSPLLDTPGYQRKPNLGMLGEYLCDDVRSRQDTLYQGIMRLPPGHQLVLKNGMLLLNQYFRIDPAKTIRYASDADYAEHFFDIFKEAVCCRLRSQTPVSHFVSGGLDSSSILGMTHHLIRTGLVDCGLPAVYTLLSSDPNADERSYLYDVAGMWGDTVHSASMDKPATDPLISQVQRYRDFPDFPNCSVLDPLYKLVQANGSRVTLSGTGGDEWLTGNRAHCADLLLQLRIPALIRQLRNDAAQSRIWGTRRFSAWDAVRWSLFPLIPYTLKTTVRRHIWSHVPRWISPGFARAVNLKERLITARPPAFPTLAQRAIHGALVRGSDALGQEINDRLDARLEIEGRYPFNDRRLIEFALALPEEQRWRDGKTKYVLRQAMAGLLPHSVLKRNGKAEFSNTYNEAITRESAGGVLQSLRLSAEGYVDARVLRDMHQRCVSGDLMAMGPVWMILALESWFKTAFPEVV